MDRTKNYARIMVILFVFAGLVLVFRSFVVAYIVEPIALLCWAAWRVVASVDQNIYWTLLIVLCCILVFRIVLSGDKRSSQSAYAEIGKPLDRIGYWKTLIEDASLGKDESEALCDSLKGLLISTIAESERLDSIDGAEDVWKGQASLPPVVRKLLSRPGEKRELFLITRTHNVLSLLPKRFRRWSLKFLCRDDTLMSEILMWMEAELDGRDRKGGGWERRKPV